MGNEVSFGHDNVQEQVALQDGMQRPSAERQFIIRKRLAKWDQPSEVTLTVAELEHAVGTLLPPPEVATTRESRSRADADATPTKRAQNSRLSELFNAAMYAQQLQSGAVGYVVRGVDMATRVASVGGVRLASPTVDHSEMTRQCLVHRTQVPFSPPDDLHNLCATICHELNFHEDPATFKSAMIQAFGHVSIKCAMLINQGVLYSRLAFVVRNKTAVIAWRGSKTLVEWVTDSGFSPSICLLWIELCREIKVHGSIMAVLQHDFCIHFASFHAKALELGVDRLVFSGHSLGGGLAQVAHLATLGQVHVGKMHHFSIQTLVFAAPMVFVLPDVVSDNTRAVLDRIYETSVNWIYHADVVPRLPGHPDFWVPAARDLMSHLAKKKISDNQIGNIAWKLLSGDGRLDLLFESMQKLTNTTIDALKSYRHTAKLYVMSPYSKQIVEVEQHDHASFLNILYRLPDGCEETQRVETQRTEAEFLAEFHLCLPRNMARTYGNFRLKHVASGRCLAMSADGEFSMEFARGLDRDDWYWKRVRVPWFVRPPDGTFKLQGKLSGKFLAINKSGYLEAQDETNLDDQCFRLISGSDGAFRLENIGASKLLAFVKWTSSEACLGLCPLDAGNQQEWKITNSKVPKDPNFDGNRSNLI